MKRTLITALCGVCMLTALPLIASAQTAGRPMSHPPVASPGAPGMTPVSSGMSGAVIGDKKTHVYHLPGDKSMLPAPQNRVYFYSATQAAAAGYKVAGVGGAHGRHQTTRVSRHVTNRGTGHAGASGVPATAAQLNNHK